MIKHFSLIKKNNNHTKLEMNLVNNYNTHKSFDKRMKKPNFIIFK